MGLLGVLDPVKLRLYSLKRASEPAGEGRGARAAAALRWRAGPGIGGDKGLASGGGGGRDGDRRENE